MAACSVGPRRRALNCFKEMRGVPADDGCVPAPRSPEARSLTSSDPQPVDLRGLPPPEPLERILAALAEERAAPLTFLLSMEPLPLYVILRKAGVRYRVRRTPGAVEITLDRSLRNP